MSLITLLLKSKRKMKKLILLLLQCFAFYFVDAQCTFTDSSNVQIGSITKVNADCATNGAITLNSVTGGGGTYAYEIVSGPVIRIIQSQNTFAALPGGNYVVRVNGCNGTFLDSTFTIVDQYVPMRTSYWQSYGNTKVSGFTCSVTNNGVYKSYKPIEASAPGGKAPFSYQISTSTNFTGVPFTPTTNST